MVALLLAVITIVVVATMAAPAAAPVEWGDSTPVSKEHATQRRARST
jgi:hypothetical protein